MGACRRLWFVRQLEKKLVPITPCERSRCALSRARDFSPVGSLHLRAAPLAPLWRGLRSFPIYSHFTVLQLLGKRRPTLDRATTARLRSFLAHTENTIEPTHAGLIGDQSTFIILCGAQNFSQPISLTPKTRQLHQVSRETRGDSLLIQLACFRALYRWRG